MYYIIRTYFLANLKDATVRTISDNECGQTYNLNLDSIQCTRNVSGAVCSGDSGGFLGVEAFNIWWQYGVTSFVASAGCSLGVSRWIHRDHG